MYVCGVQTIWFVPSATSISCLLVRESCRLTLLINIHFKTCELPVGQTELQINNTYQHTYQQILHECWSERVPISLWNWTILAESRQAYIMRQWYSSRWNVRPTVTWKPTLLQPLYLLIDLRYLNTYFITQPLYLLIELRLWDKRETRMKHTQ